MTSKETADRPYIICHMMSSVDGRIDCDMTEKIDNTDSYYEALDELECDATLSGRVTMQMHTALPDRFVAKDPAPAGVTKTHKAAECPNYEIAIDTHGTLTWPDGMRNLLVITYENCPREYHERLTSQGISWIACGKDGIDLPHAMQILHAGFGIKRLAVTGGGHINAAFLKAGLLDEVSLMVGAGIDGRAGMTAVFDGIADSSYPVTLLTLTDVRRAGDNTVWMRYTVRK